MKRACKLIFGILGALILLAAAAVAVLRFAFGIDVFDRSGWHETEEGGRQYLRYDGTPVEGWLEVEGQRYYFDPAANCTARTGWLRLEGETFWLGEDGAMGRSWQNIGGETYYFDPVDGAMHTGWLQQGTDRYWLGEDGVRHTGWLEQPDGRYYFGSGGVMHIGWLEQPHGRYYLFGDGRMTVGWLTLSEGRYYFRGDGVMHTGWLEQPDGRYYFCEDGAMALGWQELREGTRYFGEDGVVRTGWLELDGKTWLLTEDGAPHVGWLEDGTGLRWFREDGVMAVGRAEIGGETFWFDSRGCQLELVNPWNFVREDYEVELVYVQGLKVAACCRDELLTMMEDCRAAGLRCDLESGYRTHAFQTRIWTEQVERYVARGYTRAEAEAVTSRSIAVPGTSEHQLGLAMDLTRDEPTYVWLANNSWKYGFIMRYPYGKTEWTGIYYEPWHFRYVGKELAKELYDLGLCLEEYMDLLTRQAGYAAPEEAR